MKILRNLVFCLATLLPAASYADITPKDVVFSTADKVIEKLRVSRPLSDEQANALVEEMILPHLDFETFSKLTLGKYWKTASPEQRTAFTHEFRSLLMRSYATSLNSYTGQRIEHVGERDEGNGRVLIQTQLIRAEGPPITVDYRLLQRDGSWKIYDVVIEGVSMVINYRSNFSTEIHRAGLDALIKQMADRTIKASCVGAGAKKACS